MNRILKAYDKSIFHLSEKFLEVSFPFEEEYVTVSDTINDTVSDTVKQRLAAMIMAIKNKPGMKSGELAKTFGLSDVSIRRDLQKISKLVAFVGASKSGGYQTTDHLKNILQKIEN